MTKLKNIAVLALLQIAGALLSPTLAHARAIYTSKEWQMQTAPVIAIVNITSLERTEFHGKQWTYHQRAFASVETVLKGTLPRSLTLYGGEDFVCASCSFEKGRHIVFLDYDGKLLTGNGWENYAW